MRVLLDEDRIFLTLLQLGFIAVNDTNLIKLNLVRYANFWLNNFAKISIRIPVISFQFDHLLVIINHVTVLSIEDCVWAKLLALAKNLNYFSDV